ncbi:MAG: hypothetical protein HY814_10900, partial [Candidatus Riflebacteria bacterium]|nr:hypothetical protein [Candidatus Riflebacteria bacterium]
LYGHDLAFCAAIRGAIRGEQDPSQFRLDYALDSFDNAEHAKDALSNVSDQTLIHEWSNIVKPGEDGISLKQRYEEWQAVKAGTPGLLASAEQQHEEDVAHYRFVDFPLDVSRDLVQTLEQQDKVVGWTFDRVLLEYKKTVRGRIVSLPSAAVAAAIGMDANGITPLADDSEKSKEIEAVNGKDRQARSMHAHIGDTARHQMSADSLADDLTYTDEQMATYWARYGGRFGEATATKADEATPFGVVDDAESEELVALRARFDVSVEEYKKAKGKVAEVMKWVAIAAIGAVATACTGPGGATLTAAMITAGISAGASVAIDELVQGNDYDAMTEGIQKIVTDVALAGIGHELNAAWEAASKGKGVASKIVAGHAWVEGQEKAIAEAMKAEGFVGEALWEVGKAWGNVALGAVKDTAVSALDPSELKYGWLQGLTHADAVAEKTIAEMPEKMQKEAIKAVITQIGAKGKEAVGLGDPAKAGGLDVGEEGELLDDKDLLERLGEAVQTNLGAKGQLGAVWDQAVTTAGSKAAEASTGKAVGFDEADAWGFAETYVKDRATGTVGAIGKAYQSDRTARLVASRAAEFRSTIGDDPIALKHYVHYLNTKGRNDGRESLGPDPAAFMAGEWVETKRRVLAQLGSDPTSETAKAYEAWVLSDPAKTSARLGTTLVDFEQGCAKSTEWIAKMRATPGYKGLSGEERAFYESYAADPTRAFDFSKGTVDESYDLGTADGQKKFRETLAVRRELIAAEVVPEVTTGWTEEDRRSFGTWLRTTGLQGVVLDPRDAEKNKAAIAGAAGAWTEAHTLSEEDLAELDPYFARHA